MMISNSESTEVADYARDTKADATILLLNMLKKNVVAEQTSWYEAFEFDQQDLGSDWVLEEEEEV